MKQLFFILGIAVIMFASGSLHVHAQMMSGTSGISQGMIEHTRQEEAEGKEIWEKLQSKQVTCDKLSDENFETLGEYFMGLMTGDAHPAMNEMLVRMHGEEGEKQMHAVMGRRLSGCDTSAVVPAGMGGWMGMMQMMGSNQGGPFSEQGGWSPSWSNEFNHPMMWSTNGSMGWGSGLFGGIFMILWWALIIMAIIALVCWLIGKQTGTGMGKSSALDILKERYAKGEIDKKEFEEKKRDLV